MRQSTYASRQRSNAATSSFGSFAKTVRNAMNVNKKNDDFGYSNDIQGRRNKTQGFVSKIANSNPVFLIIASAFCVILFMISFVWMMSLLFSSSSNTSYSSSKSYQTYSYNKDYNNFENSKVAKDIESLLNQQKALNGDISIIKEKEFDQKMSELMNGCFNELPFSLDFNAKTTFEAHISYVFTAIIDKQQIYLSSPESTVITEHGTLYDTSIMESPKNSRFAKCSLVKELLNKAKQNGLLITDNNINNNNNTFQETNQDIWSHSDLFKDVDINAAAFELIQLSKDKGENFHLAKQLIPAVLNEYCPNIYQFFDKHEKENGSPNTNDKDPKFECVNSLQDLIGQIHEHGNIHLSKHEIPAFDKRGYLVAVDKFSLKQDQKFEDEWVSCPLLDKIVYYHNVDITQQVKVLLDEINDNNYYAFESQADVYMIEHCPDTVTTLKSKKAAHDHGDMYISVFRGELTAFAHRVAQGEYMGLHQQLQDFVVTNNGGIMHKEFAVAGYTQCKLISEIGRQSSNYNTNNNQDNNQQFDENEFNPDYHNAQYDKLEKELHHNQQQIEMDAQMIIDHATKLDDQYELRHIVTNMGYLYHSSDCVANLPSDKTETLISEIIQYIDILIEMKPDSFANGIKQWPQSHVAAIDCQQGRLLLINKDDQVLKTGNKIVSPLFTKVFQIAIQSKRQIQEIKHSDNNNDNNNNNNNGEIKSYVTVLLNDISKQRDIGQLQSDIETDLRHYCKNMMNNLTPRARRKFVSKLLNIIQGQDRQRINDPIVNEDGFLKTSHGVDPQREKIYKCTFLTELIAQKLQ